MTFRQVAGAVLAILVLLSTGLGILGIWGAIPGDTAWKLFGTAIVIGVGVGGTSGVVDTFFGKPKEPKDGAA